MFVQIPLFVIENQLAHENNMINYLFRSCFLTVLPYIDELKALIYECKIAKKKITVSFDTVNEFKCA